MTTAEIKSRTAQIETCLSAAAGFPVEVTIRSLTEFTLSADGDRTADLEKLLRVIDPKGDKVKSAETGYDLECDHSCLWFAVH